MECFNFIIIIMLNGLMAITIPHAIMLLNFLFWGETTHSGGGFHFSFSLALSCYLSTLMTNFGSTHVLNANFWFKTFTNLINPLWYWYQFHFHFTALFLAMWQYATVMIRFSAFVRHVLFWALMHISMWLLPMIAFLLPYHSLLLPFHDMMKHSQSHYGASFPYKKLLLIWAGRVFAARYAHFPGLRPLSMTMH